MQPGGEFYELAARVEPIDRFMLRHYSDIPVDLWVVSRRLTKDGHLPSEAEALPVIMCRIVDLSAPLGPSRPVMPGRT